MKETINNIYAAIGIFLIFTGCAWCVFVQLAEVVK